MEKNIHKTSWNKRIIDWFSILIVLSFLALGCTQNSSSIQDLYPDSELLKISDVPVTKIDDLVEFYEIGDLDEIPIAFEDKGWMIKKDGLYGFIDFTGKVTIEPKYKNILDTASPTYPESSIFLYNEEDYSDLIQLPYGFSKVTPGIGGVLSPQFFMAKDGTLVGSASQSLPQDKPFTVFLEGTSYEERPNSDYYIYFPKLGKGEGPFSSEEKITYFQRSEFLPYGFFNISLEDFFILPASSNRKETYLIDRKNNLAIQGFDFIEPADHQTFIGLKDDKAYVFYKDLSTGIGYEAESAARSIGEVIPLKVDGSWKLFVSKDFKEFL